MLSQDSTLTVAAEASTLAEAVSLSASEAFDVVLLDLIFPDGSALDALETLRERSPNLPVVIFSNQVDAVDRAMARGASAFVTKDSDLRELRQAIQSAVEGKPFISRGATASQGDGDAPHHRLSKREHQIMMKMIAGQRNKEIAFELDISEKTVATHRARLFKKMDLENLRGLLLYAVNHGLADWV